LRASEPVATPRFVRTREALSHRTLPLLRRLAREFLRRQATTIVLALVAMGLVAAATAANAWLMEPLLDKIFVGRQVGLLWIVAAAVLGIATVKGVASYAQSILMYRVGQRVVADIQRALFRRVIGADLAFFHANPTGTLIARFVSDAGLLRSASANVLVGIGKDALTVVFLVAVMFYQDWALALASFVVFPIAIRPIASVGRRMRRATVSTQSEVGQFMTLLDQTFQGARHVKAYGMEAYETARADRLIESVNRLLNRAARIRSATSPLMETLGGIAVSTVILYGGYQVIEGTRTAGTFFSFITALLLAYQPMKTLANLTTNLQEGLAAAQRIFTVLDIEPEIRDAPGALPLAIRGGEVRLDAVCFTYPNGGPALNGAGLVVPAG
jgi:subfamily B ATP-binding cassette protein MsbA